MIQIKTITRGELAKWLSKAYDLKPGNEKLPFKDVEGDYIPAVSALVNNGITKGTTETTFGTHDMAKRGDFAKFVYRAAQASAEIISRELFRFCTNIRKPCGERSLQGFCFPSIYSSNL